MSAEADHPLPAEPGDSRTSGLRTDTFSLSVVLLISVMLAQRGVGLVRNVLLCGMLTQEELGRWSLANNYLGWAAPFVVLGLPGSFGRLSEHFRHQGQLRQFLHQTALVSFGLMLVAVVVHALIPSWFAGLVYNNQDQVTLIPVLGLVLGAVITLNFFVEFLTSLRCNRVVSRMYLVQTLLFATSSVALLMVTTMREEAVVLAFGISSAIAAILGVVHVLRELRTLPPSNHTIPRPSTMWRRIAALAAWLWIGNSVANLFDCTDQFLLKHYLDLPPETVDAMIGQLYASRVLPIMIVSVAVLTGGCLLPYLIKDWESGHQDLAKERMNSVIKFCAIGFTAVAALTHIASPILFGWLLRGKYDHGLELMPWGFVQYSWFGLLAIANKYLICVDKPRIGILPLGVGLASAAALVTLLAPEWGLQGVVVAMTTANGIAFVTLLKMTAWCGMQWHRTALIAALIPLTMCLGGWASLAIIAVLVIGGWRNQWLFTLAERQQFQEAFAKVLARVKPERPLAGLSGR
jgi:O-antigen/teichoic acid export membrane protein